MDRLVEITAKLLRCKKVRRSTYGGLARIRQCANLNPLTFFFTTARQGRLLATTGDTSDAVEVEGEAAGAARATPLRSSKAAEDAELKRSQRIAERKASAKAGDVKGKKKSGGATPSAA